MIFNLLTDCIMYLYNSERRKRLYTKTNKTQIIEIIE